MDGALAVFFSKGKWRPALGWKAGPLLVIPAPAEYMRGQAPAGIREEQQMLLWLFQE